MAVTGTLTLSGILDGEPEGQTVINVSWEVEDGIFSVSTVDLASGTNTFTIPDDTTLIFLIPPSTNVFSVTLKGAGGDAGIAIGKNTATVISRKGLGVANTFVLSAASAVTGFKVLFV